MMTLTITTKKSRLALAFLGTSGLLMMFFQNNEFSFFSASSATVSRRLATPMSNNLRDPRSMQFKQTVSDDRQMIMLQQQYAGVPPQQTSNTYFSMWDTTRPSNAFSQQSLASNSVDLRRELQQSNEEQAFNNQKKEERSEQGQEQNQPEAIAVDPLSPSTQTEDSSSPAFRGSVTAVTEAQDQTKDNTLQSSTSPFLTMDPYQLQQYLLKLLTTPMQPGDSIPVPPATHSFVTKQQPLPTPSIQDESIKQGEQQMTQQEQQQQPMNSLNYMRNYNNMDTSYRQPEISPQVQLQQQQQQQQQQGPEYQFQYQQQQAMTKSSSNSNKEDNRPQTPEEGALAPVDFSVVETTLNHFEETNTPFNPKDIPIFWHIPKAGGSTIKDVIGSCHRFVMATEWGITDGHDQDTDIAIVYPSVPGATSTDRSPFVNVDTTTLTGIQRAARMGFADSGLADAVVTPFLWEANELFTDTAKGRFFSVFRNPIDRAVSMFYYLQVATWEPTYSPDLKEWTLLQYATSEKVENNWMVRQLSNTLGGEINDSHLALAKDVVRRKVLVGLMTKLDESMTRFEKFFHWKYHVNPPNQEVCRERLIKGGSNSNSKNKKEKPKPGDATWEALTAQNTLDIQLYEYIEELFQEQAALVEGVPDDYRLIDATCCKCNPATFPPEGFTCPEAVLN